MRTVSVGDVVMDLRVDVAALPDRGAAAEIRDRAWSPGGSCLNFAVASARLGCRTDLYGAVGDDEMGARLRAALAEESGLRARLAEREAAETGLSVVAVDDGGERTLLFDRGAYRDLEPRDVDLDRVAGADLLHTTGYTLDPEPLATATTRAVRRAAEAGTTVALDPSHGFAAAAEEHAAVLERVDVLLPNRREAERLAGARDLPEVLDELRALGPATVAVTLGADGCVVLAGDERVDVPAVPADAVDTVGAGDAFAAGFLAGRGRFDLSLREAGLLGNAAGALATERRGGSPAMPTLNRLREFLRSVNDDDRADDPAAVAAALEAADD